MFLSRPVDAFHYCRFDCSSVPSLALIKFSHDAIDLIQNELVAGDVVEAIAGKQLAVVLTARCVPLLFGDAEGPSPPLKAVRFSADRDRFGIARWFPGFIAASAASQELFPAASEVVHKVSAVARTLSLIE